MKTLYEQMAEQFEAEPKKFDEVFYTIQAATELARDCCRDVKVDSYCALLDLMDIYTSALREILFARDLYTKQLRPVDIRPEQIEKIGEAFQRAFGSTINQHIRRKLFVKLMGWEPEEIALEGPVVKLRKEAV